MNTITNKLLKIFCKILCFVFELSIDIDSNIIKLTHSLIKKVIFHQRFAKKEEEESDFLVLIKSIKFKNYENLMKSKTYYKYIQSLFSIVKIYQISKNQKDENIYFFSKEINEKQFHCFVKYLSDFESNNIQNPEQTIQLDYISMIFLLDNNLNNNLSTELINYLFFKNVKHNLKSCQKGIDFWKLDLDLIRSCKIIVRTNFEKLTTKEREFICNFIATNLHQLVDIAKKGTTSNRNNLKYLNKNYRKIFLTEIMDFYYLLSEKNLSSLYSKNSCLRNNDILKNINPKKSTEILFNLIQNLKIETNNIFVFFEILTNVISRLLVTNNDNFELENMNMIFDILESWNSELNKDAGFIDTFNKFFFEFQSELYQFILKNAFNKHIVLFFIILLKIGDSLFSLNNIHAVNKLFSNLKIERHAELIQIYSSVDENWKKQFCVLFPYFLFLYTANDSSFKLENITILISVVLYLQKDFLLIELFKIIEEKDCESAAIDTISKGIIITDFEKYENCLVENDNIKQIIQNEISKNKKLQKFKTNSQSLTEDKKNSLSKPGALRSLKKK